MFGVFGIGHWVCVVVYGDGWVVWCDGIGPWFMGLVSFCLIAGLGCIGGCWLALSLDEVVFG